MNQHPLIFFYPLGIPYPFPYPNPYAMPFPMPYPMPRAFPMPRAYPMPMPRADAGEKPPAKSGGGRAAGQSQGGKAPVVYAPYPGKMYCSLIVGFLINMGCLATPRVKCTYSIKLID